MKKTYQNPTIVVANIELQKMIAASEQITMSTTDYDGEAQIESRRHNSLWDDDDE